MLYVQCFPFYLQNDLRMNAMVFLFSDEECRICFLGHRAFMVLSQYQPEEDGFMFLEHFAVWAICSPISGFACCYSSAGLFSRR